jgi:hypothetical protein
MTLNRGEPDHPHWKKPPTPKEMAAVWWGLGACFVVLGLQQWFNPSLPPFTGRWSWVDTIAFNAMGQHGPAYMHMGIGAILLIAGCLKWLEHRSQKRT